MDRDRSPQHAARPAGAEGAGTDSGMPPGVQTVERAFAVLQLLARLGSCSVGQVAEALGVHKSTASRVLTALEAFDMVHQDRDRGRYELGLGILRLANAVPARLNLVNEAREEMRHLAEEHRETVTLAVLRDGLAVNLDQEMGPTTITSHNWVGKMTPLHATSDGKVLLAALSSAERARLIAERDLPALTGRTITSRRELELQLLDVAANGYAVALEEFEIGLNGLAVPVRDHLGGVIASISISGPAFRFTEEAMQGVLEDLQAAGLAVSRRMGYSPELQDSRPTPLGRARAPRTARRGRA